MECYIVILVKTSGGFEIVSSHGPLPRSGRTENFYKDAKSSAIEAKKEQPNSDVRIYKCIGYAKLDATIIEHQNERF